MNRTPFVRLPEENSVSSRKSDIQDTSFMGNSNGSQGLIHGPLVNSSSANPSTSSGYSSVLAANSRFRGQKEVDINKWDEEASQHLLTMKRPPGNLCDFLRPWRRLCRLRYPPPSQKMAENVENGFRLPFGVVWFVRDCAGCVCMTFTWLLILYGEFVVACIILPQIPSSAIAWTFGILFHVFVFLATASHLKTVFTDPGAIRLGNATREAVMRIYLVSGSNTPLIRCPKCLCIKPERAHHCSCCRRCVRKMDHHCPWVNNCVGEGNQKFFVLFNLYIFLLSVAGVVLAISFFLSCFSEFGMCEYPGSYSATASLICNIFLISESFFFGLFTSIMSCSQVSVIISDETVSICPSLHPPPPLPLFPLKTLHSLSFCFLVFLTLFLAFLPTPFFRLRLHLGLVLDDGHNTHVAICKNRLFTSFGATNASLTSLPSTMLAISAGFESLLFGIFTAAIGGSQLFSICKDETAVESLKRDKRAARPRISKRESLANVFGRPFSWRWFSPFHPPAPLTPVIPPPTADLAAKDGESSTDGADVDGQYHYGHQAAEGHEQQYNDVYLV